MGFYMRKIDLVYDGADSITMNWFNEVLYKIGYYSINAVNMCLVTKNCEIRNVPRRQMLKAPLLNLQAYISCLLDRFKRGVFNMFKNMFEKALK